MSKRPRTLSPATAADQPYDDSRTMCTGPLCHGIMRKLELEATLDYAKKSGNKEAPWYGVWALVLSCFLSQMYEKEKSKIVVLTPSFPQHPVTVSLDTRDEVVQDRVDAFKLKAKGNSLQPDGPQIEPQEDDVVREEDVLQGGAVVWEEDVLQGEIIVWEEDVRQEEDIIQDEDFRQDGDVLQEEDRLHNIFQYSPDDVPEDTSLDELDIIPRPSSGSHRSSRRSSHRSSRASTPIIPRSDDEFEQMPTDAELAAEHAAAAARLAEEAAKREAELAAVVPLATLKELDMSKRIPDFLQKICQAELIASEDDEEDTLSVLRSRTILIVEIKPQVLCELPFETTEEMDGWINKTARWKVSSVLGSQCQEQAIHVFHDDETIHTLGCIVSCGDLWNYSEFDRDSVEAASEYVPSSQESAPAPAPAGSQSLVKQELDSIFNEDNVVSIRSMQGRQAFKLVCKRLKELNADYFQE